jgi:iron-sulfur cluster assembly protein
MMPVTLTDKAVVRILEVLNQENIQHQYLRIGVKGGGCSGLQYVLDFTTETTDFDLEFEQSGIKIVIDQISSGLLEGTVVDYLDSLSESGFKFLNSKATRSCGCGKSFSS